MRGCVRRRPGTPVPSDGFFVGPTVFDEVSLQMKIGREEIFGPVARPCPAKTLDEVFQLMQMHPNANATSIFTSSGKSAREFAHRATASMVGVNIGVAAPMAYFPFGGARDSFFGDLRCTGATPSISIPTRKSRSRAGGESRRRRRKRFHTEQRG